MSADAAPSQVDGGREPRHLGVADSVALLVGTVVGSGIFVAPAEVARIAPGFAPAAALWLAAGIVAACGALVYAECSTRVPRTGGFFAFQRVAMGEEVAFVGGWSALLVTYPASIAAISLVFASYLGQLVPAAGGKRGAAVAALVGCGLLNVVGLRTGPWTQRILTAVKLAALAVLCAAAVLSAGARPATVSAPGPGAAGFGAILGAFLWLLWAYEGWSNVSLVAGEIRDPGRNMGRTVVLGFAILLALYGGVQMAVLRLLPPDRAAASGRVLAEAVEAGLGPGAGRWVAALVVVSTVGAAHGVILTVSRLAYAMARDGAFFRGFGRWNPHLGAPARAVVAVTALAVAYVFLGGVGDLLAYFSFSVWIFYALSAFSLLILRRRGVGDPGGWRAPGGAVAPVVVLAAAVAMTASVAARDPVRSAVGAVLILAGFPAFLVWKRRRERQS